MHGLWAPCDPVVARVFLEGGGAGAIEETVETSAGQPVGRAYTVKRGESVDTHQEAIVHADTDGQLYSVEIIAPIADVRGVTVGDLLGKALGDEPVKCARGIEERQRSVYCSRRSEPEILFTVTPKGKKAIEFRQWATKTLREHITKGYTLNRARITQNYDAFMKAVADVQHLLPEHVTLNPKAVLELIKEFATTWVSLDAYDKESLVLKGITKKKVSFVSDDLVRAIAQLKSVLMKKGEATDLFASERVERSIEGIVGNVMQSFGGTPVYKTIEEKAAHLLYFMVKNHPFTDGNKRSGAFAFIWFLKKTGVKGSRTITPAALTALTLLVAESDPKKKDQVVALITNLLR